MIPKNNNKKQMNQSQQQTKTKKKSILPFNKQLIQLQKKIQQVQDKNQRILQQIHKAYNFKKKNVPFQAKYKQNQNQNQIQQGNYQAQKYAMRENYLNNNQPNYRNPQINKSYNNQKNHNLRRNSHQQNNRINYSIENQNRNNNKMIPVQMAAYIHHVVPQKQYLQLINQAVKSPSQQSQQSDFKSNQNYSDVQRHELQFQNNKQKGFSDIKSSIQDRRYHHTDHRNKPNNYIKNSYIYKDFQNNSLYSQGHIPSSRQHIETQQLDQLSNPNINRQFIQMRPTSYIQYNENQNYISARQKLNQNQNQNQYSYSQIYPTQNHIPVSIVNDGKKNNRSSYTPKGINNQTQFYQQNYRSYVDVSSSNQPNQMNFLHRMYMVEHQKVIFLEQQVAGKQQKINHMKKYKKNFKNYINSSFIIFQQAFQSYVQQFLKNKLYYIEKMSKKNQNRLISLLLTLKDFKQQRQYNKTIKQNLQNKSRKYYSNDIGEQRTNRILNFPQNNLNEDHIFEQNKSTFSNKSANEKSAKSKNKSRDKSITKKIVNQNQIMKKEFENIAQKYQAMLKVKTDQIQKYQQQIKNNKIKIKSLEQQVFKLKKSFSQNNIQGSSLQLQPRNSGNLKILSRSSSRNSLKRGSNLIVFNDDNNNNEQYLQKIKKLQQQLQIMQRDKRISNEKNESLKYQNQKFQSQINSLAEKVQKLSNLHYKENNQNLKNIKILQEQKQKIIYQLEQSQKINLSLQKQLQLIHGKLIEKDKRISQLDSQKYLKENQIKKLQNQILLKNHKIQQFNKLLLSGNKQININNNNNNKQFNLNDSILSISMAQDNPNRSTMLVLQNLQKQLQQQTQQKQIQFLKLKRNYQTKIQKFKNDLQEITFQNQKLIKVLKQNEIKNYQLQKQIQILQENLEQAQQKINQLLKQNAFLNDKINYYEKDKKNNKSQNKSNLSDKEDLILEQFKPSSLDYHNLSDFPDQISNHSNQRQEKSLQFEKLNSNQIQLLDQSSGMTASFNPIKYISQNKSSFHGSNQEKDKVKLQHLALSQIKNQNLVLCQKIAKLQRQNIFLVETQKQSNQKIQYLKNQILNLTQKYQQLQTYNQELQRIIQEVQKNQKQIETKQQSRINGIPPFAWKDMDQSNDNLQSKNYILGTSFNFGQKEDGLYLDKSLISSYNFPNTSRKSIDRTIQQLNKKLVQAEQLIENKQKTNEQLIKSFTRQIDRLNNQINEQKQIIQKYLKQNQQLRKQKQVLQQEIIKKGSQNEDNINNLIGSFEQNLLIQEYKQPSQTQLGNFLQKRIQVIDQQPQQQQQSNRKNLLQYQQPQKKRYVAMLQFDQLQQNQGQLQIQQQFDQKNEQLKQMQNQINQLQDSLSKMTEEYKKCLIKIKQKQEQKNQIVQELKKKSQEVDQLKDLLQLKHIAKNTQQLYGNKSYEYSLNLNQIGKNQLQKSDKNRMTSRNSLKYSHHSNLNHNQNIRKSSMQDQINFDFVDSMPNNQTNSLNSSINYINNHMNLTMQGNIDQASRLSNILSQNMSMIFQKEENFFDQVKKAKYKRKQEAKLLRKTFQYIRKLRISINEKNKKIKKMQLRLEQLKDNCWLWKKNNNNQLNQNPSILSNQTNDKRLTNQKIQQQNRQINQINQIDYTDQNNQQFLKDQKLVDSRLFDCNSQDLNKKKPLHHNHYKMLEYDTKLILEENKILTKQIQILQSQILKIQQQQNALMSVKQLYKQQIHNLQLQNESLKNNFQNQMQKMQQILQNSESIHNFQAIKQLFRKIIDSFSIMMTSNTIFFNSDKRINSQTKQQKRKQAQECIKVLCSILSYDETVKNQLYQKIKGMAIHM